jgi:predicted DNA-binding transcriptional regulator AlpA
MHPRANYGWPRLIRLPTAAAYLDMTKASFIGEVARGGFPAGMMFAGRERWDRHAIDAALNESPEDDWRRHQLGLAAADPANSTMPRKMVCSA